ncbi:MAG: ATP-binding protein [Pseudomonadota bacterium]|nr:ATP-binding protein [Pseudomonadota bacterium]
MSITLKKSKKISEERSPSSAEKFISPNVVLESFPDIILIIDKENKVLFVNSAAEDFLYLSRGKILGKRLDKFFFKDSPLFDLLKKVKSHSDVIRDEEFYLASIRSKKNLFSAQVSGVTNYPGVRVIRLQEKAITKEISQRFQSIHAGQSLSVMSKVFAHEIKNPLSGIRGAAQLLEDKIPGEDFDLTKMIRDEVDRICRLVDKIDVFNGDYFFLKSELNIHKILEHVKTISLNGFAKRIIFEKNYDPSLPPIAGHEDQLIQAFLNLIKNSSEALGNKEGRILLKTLYNHPSRTASNGSAYDDLPIVVEIHDNGSDISKAILNSMFDPFITTKKTGSGLGLSVASKIISDHGGTIEFTSKPGETICSVRFPINSKGKLDK